MRQKVAQSEKGIYNGAPGILPGFQILAEGGGAVSTHQYVLPEDQAGRRSGARLLYVSYAQYSQEWNSALHTHGCAELFFITGGHGEFQVRQERFPVAINDLVVVNTSVPHTETSQNGSPMEYIVLGVEGLETLTDLSGCALMHLLAEQEMVTGCLRMMVQEARGNQPGWARICQSLLEVILQRLLRREDFALSNPTVGPQSSRECDLVRRYIDNHFKENLTLDQLAALVHVNKYHLAHAFRREFDASPISYLITRRIQESRFLLSETDHSISQIAQILGFSSQSYFSQSFRRQEGTSPLEYRRRHRRQRTSGPPV
ncbi:MAG: AraC family transcriptional regulator [Oscillibacter sp.]|nr:AraC family transcriptional regulator [Oscillibacter sp.]